MLKVLSCDSNKQAIIFSSNRLIRTPVLSDRRLRNETAVVLQSKTENSFLSQLFIFRLKLFFSYPMYEKNDFLSSQAATPRRRNVSVVRPMLHDSRDHNDPSSHRLTPTQKNNEDDIYQSRYLAYSKRNSEDRYSSSSYSSAMGGASGATTFFNSFPAIFKRTLFFAFGAASILYILNQKHLLPRPLSAVVSRVLFWPTLPITYSKRIGKWITVIDDTVVMGGAPIHLLNYPEILRKEYGVKGVINLCQEYRGPIHEYKRLKMEELYLPTTDHFEPSVEDMIVRLCNMNRRYTMDSFVFCI